MIKKDTKSDDKLDPGVSVIGIPLDENSSFMEGASGAPSKIRDSYFSPASNFFTEELVNLEKISNFYDMGDIKFSSSEDKFIRIYDDLYELYQSGHRVISLGGDHSITWPALQAASKIYSNLTILHFDAHPDLYDNFLNNPFSHASPFARIMENKLANKLVQVGIRTMNTHQKEQADRFNVQVYDMITLEKGFSFKFNGPVYISLDLDVLDPAYAPGLSHYEPGGMNIRDVLQIIQKVNAPVIGADIVELNPERDINGITAMTAAKFLKEIAGKMIQTQDKMI